MFDTPELNHLCHGDEDSLDDLMMLANAFGSFLLKKAGYLSIGPCSQVREGRGLQHDWAQVSLGLTLSLLRHPDLASKQSKHKLL